MRAIAVLAVGAVALAVLLQQQFGMEPCAWCVFQRLLFLAVAVAALLALSLRAVLAGFVVAASLTGLLALGGVWTALYQQFVASQTGSCAYTFADRFLMRTGLDEALPWLFEARASCADANAPLLGLPFSIWSAILFAVLCLMTLAAIAQALREARDRPMRLGRRE